MTTFSEAFRSTRDLCISQGRRPVACLIGPDVQPEFYKFAAETDWYMWSVVQLSYTQKLQIVAAAHDLGIYSGVHIKRMEHEGLAMVTAPMPESGFDLP